jgi:hypothetical protein
LGLTNNALNFENTLNISFAFLAVPSLSLNRAMIWFCTHDTLMASILGGHPKFRALYNIKSRLG